MFYYILIGALVAYIAIVAVFQLKKSKQRGSKAAKKVAFFHPFCNDGGGGEKVLWSMIQALLEQMPATASLQQYKDEPIINVYSLERDSHEILSKASARFNINLLAYAHRINFIHITGRSYLTPKSKLTMVFHILLPMIYCLKCIWRYQPDIFYDTTGFAFNFIPVKILLPWTECRAYVHYPFISEDMIAKIRQKRIDYNNDASISQSAWKTKVKLVYYTVILWVYKMLRITVSRAEANSTWTQNHMKQIWGSKVTKLYPPCTLTQLFKYKKNYKTQHHKIMSLAQFRPQKNHALQIDVIQNIVNKLKGEGSNSKIHLYICGTTRGADDEKILDALRCKVTLLKLEQHISFCVNMKFTELLKKLEECNYGIHSMEAEHFGISVVEMLAAGCLIVAHNSAGPKLDIIKYPRFLAQSAQQYEEKLTKIIKMSPEEKQQISKQFRLRMAQFGQVQFKQNFRMLFNRQRNKNK